MSAALAAAADRLLAAPARDRRRLIERERRRPGLVAELKRRADLELRADAREALRIAGVARAAGRAAGDALDRAMGEHAFAKALHALGRHLPALEHYQLAAGGYRALGRMRERAGVEMARVDALFRVGRFAEASAAARASRRLFGQLGDRLGEAKVLVNQANLCHARERHHQALTLLGRARPAFAAAGDRTAVASVDIDRACSLSLLGRFAESGPLFEAVRRDCAARGASELVAVADYNLAYDRFLQGRFADARRLLQVARDGFRRAGSRHHLALAALDEAEIDLALSLPRRAAAAAAEARREFLAVQAPLPAARAALFAAQAAQALGEVSRGRELLAAARAEFEAAGHAIGVGDVDLALASDPGSEPAERERRALAAARLFGRRRLKARQAAALAVAGAAALERGPGGRAERHLRRALAGARALGLGAVELRAEQGLARAVRGRSPRRALGHYRRAVGAYERLRAGIRSDEERLAFAASRSEVFAEAVRTALDLGRPEEAYELVERARARALVDLLGADSRFADAALAHRSRLARRLQRLKRTLDRLDAERRTSERRASPVPQPLAEELRRLGAEREGALDELGQREPEASYVLAGRPLATLEDARALLGRERALLVYFGEGRHLGALLVTESEVRAYRGLAATSEVERVLAELRFLIAAPRFDPGRTRAARAARLGAVASSLERLRCLLLGPLEADLGERALVVVAPARLHRVPFHALARRGRPLIAEREVTLAPSATVLVQAAARRPRRQGALVVSLPDQAAPAIAEEARAVARILSARSLSGCAATSGRLRREAARARVVHLACHGVYDPDEPLLSGLDLHDGRLTLPEVAALGLDASLVTLSACDSAVGTASGDEVLGLVRSFLQAGTRALVASLWSVPDSSTAWLMQAFYRRVAAGAAVATALREAALEIRREREHPYHWAPFLVVGHWGAVC